MRTDEKKFYSRLAEKADQEMHDIGCTQVYLRDMNQAIQDNPGAWFDDSTLVLIEKAKETGDDVIIGYFLHKPIIAD